MKRKIEQHDTAEKDDDTEEEANQSDDRVSSEASSANSSQSSQQPGESAMFSVAASAPMPLPSAVGTIAGAGRNQTFELEHRRKASRKSSMRHQVRKRIETEHLAELQAKLQTINAQLRKENESLRSVINELRKSVDANPIQAYSSTQPTTTATRGQLNVNQQRFINNILPALQGTSQNNTVSQIQPVLPVSAPPPQPTTIPPPPQPTAMLRSIQLAMMQQRLNLMPLAYQQGQHLFFPPLRAPHIARLQTGTLPYAAAAGFRQLPSFLTLPNNNSVLHQQGAFGAQISLSSEGEDEGIKPKAQDRG